MDWEMMEPRKRLMRPIAMAERIVHFKRTGWARYTQSEAEKASYGVLLTNIDSTERRYVVLDNMRTIPSRLTAARKMATHLAAADRGDFAIYVYRPSTTPTMGKGASRRLSFMRV